jgi:protein-S-isoprenylcysteine O-methyltransferase Ste14
MQTFSESAGASSSDAPRSATPFSVGVFATVTGLATLALTGRYTALDSASRGVDACLSIFVVLATYELFVARVHLRASTGLAAQALRPVSARRVLARLGALGSIYAGIALIYWLLPEYHGSFYAPYWALIEWLAPWVALSAPLYFAWMDRRLQSTEDAYLQWGRLLFLRRAPQDWRAIRELMGGWAVKAFFLPLMTVYLSSSAHDISQAFAAALAAPYTIATYRFLYDLGFTIDLLVVIVGYLCTLRILDAHVRSAEPTTLGWLVALVCYQPFWSLIGNQYLGYQGSMYWDSWLVSEPLLRLLWGTAIIALIMIYASATMAFGLRFSNLTNRGIITSGPYRFTKHPAYLSKNLAWWMISVPFIEPLGWHFAIMHTAALATLNCIYFMRAKTEERHLMRDPDYRAYAAWIERHGLFASFSKRDALG